MIATADISVPKNYELLPKGNDADGELQGTVKV